MRKGLTQRRLALRAGTSQSAVARIEREEEEVTWSRLRSLMISMGEEPVLGCKPLRSRYDAADMEAQRRLSASTRLQGGFAFNRFASELRRGVRAAKREPAR